jgi:hypothetical protein
MQTGLIENWTGNPLEIGPMYPFVGMEMVLFGVCFALSILYTIWQLRLEAGTYEREARALVAEADLSATIIAGAPDCYERSESINETRETIG